MRIIGHTGGAFLPLHEALVGARVAWAKLDPRTIAQPLLARARDTWAHRAGTELQSVRVMTRFLNDVLAAGDPLEVYAACVRAIEDEVRHTALCVGLVEALGARAVMPEAEEERSEFLALPPAARALSTAITMLVVNETISVALIADLHARCTHETVRAVLSATLEDEDEHGPLGETYVAASLARFDDEGRAWAARVAREAVLAQRQSADDVLTRLPPGQRELDAWPEPELAALGLLGAEREAIIVTRAIDEKVQPVLARLVLA